jgi:ATP-dependent RNA helicase DDX60
MAIEETPVRWQLRLFGQYLDRSFDSRPDPRVSFFPDAWQRDVLDKLDRDESILVVAPTSAGKTFISFYAMEKVLRQGDTTVLLYIAPTKALVTQIAAEVVARFKKDLRSGSCWAIHTRDQRINNPQGCQILITVPEMAAIMLLSPPLAQTWTPRIKRIILDEIHSIGQQEGGAVWEQLLLLAPCPIIGLSATIGKAEIFNEVSPSYGGIQGIHDSFAVAFLRTNNPRFPTFNGRPRTSIFTSSKVLLSYAANHPRLQRHLRRAGI